MRHLTARLSLFIAVLAQGCLLGPQEEPPALPSARGDVPSFDDDGEGSSNEVDADSDGDYDANTGGEGESPDDGTQRLDVRRAIELAPGLLLPSRADPRLTVPSLPEPPSDDEPGASEEDGDARDDGGKDDLDAS